MRAIVPTHLEMPFIRVGLNLLYRFSSYIIGYTVLINGIYVIGYKPHLFSFPALHFHLYIIILSAAAATAAGERRVSRAGDSQSLRPIRMSLSLLAPARMHHRRPMVSCLPTCNNSHQQQTHNNQWHSDVLSASILIGANNTIKGTCYSLEHFSQKIYLGK